MDAIRNHRSRNIGKHIPKVYGALPGPDEPGIDYEGVRDRVHTGMNAIKSALKILVDNRRAEMTHGGMRGRKVFRRAAVQQAGENVLMKPGQAIQR